MQMQNNRMLQEKDPKIEFVHRLISQEGILLCGWNFQDILRIIRSTYSQNFRPKLRDFVFLHIPDLILEI